MQQLKLSIWLFSSVLFCAALQAEPQTGCQLSVRVESELQHDAVGSHNDTLVAQQFNRLLSSLVSKVNCTLRPVALPAGRAVRLLQDGQLDIMVGMSETAERAQYSYFVGPHHTERMIVVASDLVPYTVSSLQQLVSIDGSISVAEGAYYGPQWQQLLADSPELQSRVFAAAGNQQKLAMLVSGRVIASLEDEAIVNELLKGAELHNRYRKLFVIHENPVYFMFSRQSIDSSLATELQQQWLLMLASGEVNQLKQQSPLVQ